jgi:hypothetical protein
VLAAVGAAASADDRGPAPAASAATRTITVIELPPPSAGLPGAGRQRSHHALSLATDAPKPLLRSLGLDATDCALHFRLPSRIVPSRDAGIGARLDVRLQAGLGCRF